MQFEVVQGDITEQRADGLVKATNTDLQICGGVAGQLREAAGEAIQREVTEHAPTGLGEGLSRQGLRPERGVRGSRREDGAPSIIQEILASEGATLTDVRVVADRDESYHTMRRIADELR